MAHFYGTIRGQAGDASRLGSKRSGIRSTVETWGAILSANIFHFSGMEADELAVNLSTKHGSTRPLLTITDVDTVAANMDDEKVRRRIERIHNESQKLTVEAHEAKRRKDRQRKRALTNV
jgi:hypothetical protein